MNGQLEMIPGSSRNAALSQWFTPPKLAQRLVEWAGVRGMHDNALEFGRPVRVLEPSAGNGAIVRPLVAAGADVDAIEIDTRYRDALCGLLLHPQNRVWCGDDFMRTEPSWLATCGHSYDLVVGNFPFHLDLAGEFTLHALEFAPRVCAIYPANFFYSETREKLWTQVRPTRIAHIAKRPWPGATDYVALELVKRRAVHEVDKRSMVEWWFESWG